MQVQLIGLIIAAFGALAVLRSGPMTLAVVCVAGLLQAASAMFYQGANITPGHLSILFLVLAIAVRPYPIKYGVLSIQTMRPGLFLVALGFWALFSGYLMPRLFAGEIVAYTMNAEGFYFRLTRLYPVGANFYQSVYFISGVVVFLAASSMLRTNSMMRRAATAVLIATGANVMLAVIDVVAFSSGMNSILSFIRNAEYAQAFSQISMVGIKRINGSFPEPSSFAQTALALFAFSFRLWRVGVRSKLTGPLALATFMAIFFSFSSTGYAALMVYFAFAFTAVTLGTDQDSGNPTARANRSILVMMIPLGALVAAIMVAIRPDLLDPLVNIFNGSITSKLQSESGIQRMAWNMAGFQVFLDTYGLGAGTGAVRTSSFAVSVLANLGIIGAGLFIFFFWFLFRSQPERRAPLANIESQQYAAAARAACFAYLIGACISSSLIDLGIHFYVFAGMACASLFYRVPASQAPRPMPREPMAPLPAQPAH